tara:strand:- start:172 stop:837 length:666 start_codon:yes stop_codon:yes gene_type:complete
MNKKAIIIIIASLFVNLLIAGQIKNCPKCSSNYKSEYSYCPIDGEKLNMITTGKKEIDGFQNYKWGITTEEAKNIDKDLSFETDDSKPNIIILTNNSFKFQGNDCLLKLEFNNNNLYKASLHFVTESNQASVNNYFSRVELIKDVYGDTKKIAIGRESDNQSSRLTSMNINELTYQHKWDSALGNLTYQIGSGSYGKFIHSFFYSSNDAIKIDSAKSKSEF